MRLLVALFAATLCASNSEATKLSPITRVVELLKKIAEKIEKELKEEENLYESYVCWGKSVINAKTASNDAAASRIDELTTYVADLDAGRIELTTERADLEKELEELNGDIEAATVLREKEQAEFEAAKEEMTKAITALDKAIEVLGEATEDHKEGELVQMENRMSEGFAQRVADSVALRQAVELGKHFLTKGDYIFLQKLLSGEVPKADWKKLNRKAVFKMTYKARSFKIQDVLKKLRSTFQANLDSAEEKEDDTVHTFGTLMQSKNEAKEKAQQALTNMDEESGAKGLSKSDAEDEIEALNTQKTNDEKFIKQTEDSLVTKKEEWKDRQMLRTGEIAAINKAISILHSDDNRDAFKKSFASQSFFLQEGQTRVQTQESAARRAAATLRAAGRASNDNRLVEMASSLLGFKGHFDEVIKAIAEMITLLKSQNEEDLHNKEECEEARMTDSRDAITAGRDIDDMSDKIDQLQSDIKEIVQEIDDKNAEITKITEEMKEATTLRTQENEDFQRSKADDERAIEVVNSAKDVLENFYKENDLVFFQHARKAPTAQVGEAPPPPPQTWESPYSGKTQETGSIISILTIITEDIQKDLDKATTEEEEAAAAFTKAKEEFGTQKSGLESDIAELEGTKGSKEEDIETTKENRKTRKQELDNHMQKMADAEVGCDYIAINFGIRKKNRDIELDGLIKAKAILEGGAFPDEKKDAFLQRIRRH